MVYSLSTGCVIEDRKPIRISTGCIIEEGISYPGNDIDIGGTGRYGSSKVENQEACARLSLSTDGASFWTYHPGESLCFVKTSNSGRKPNPTAISGNSECERGGEHILSKSLQSQSWHLAPCTWIERFPKYVFK